MMDTIKVTHLTIQEGSEGFLFLINGSMGVDASADITWENEDSYALFYDLIETM